jgi:predicted Rossmann fold flavoprotein
MFPTTDSSETIVDCLQAAAERTGVQLRNRCDVVSVTRRSPAGFEVTLAGGDVLECDALVLATGGTRAEGGARIAASLGHTLSPAVASLFALNVPGDWLHELAGISLEDVEVSIPGTKLQARGPLLITHKGLSGPAILRLSAWGARELHASGYACTLRVNWLPNETETSLAKRMARISEGRSTRTVARSPIPPIRARLWSRMCDRAGVDADTRWASMSRSQRAALAGELLHMELHVEGKSTNKDEFVTCGGVQLSEVNPKTMESRIVDGLYFAGEVLDVDAITGGFNFQSAWTTGWLVGTNL